MLNIKEDAKLIIDLIHPVSAPSLITYSGSKGLIIKLRRGVWDSAVVIENWWLKAYGKSLIGLSPSPVIVDIGAHIGSFTLLALKTHPSARVYSFEPSLENFAMLKTNIELNDLTARVSLNNMAVSGSTGTLSLEYNSFNAGRSKTISSANKFTQTVQSISLDDLFSENNILNCDLLKMDCEGAEWDILSAASSTTLSRINKICMEIHPGIDEKNLTTLLTDAGFKIEQHSLIDLPLLNRLVNVPLIYAYKK